MVKWIKHCEISTRNHILKMAVILNLVVFASLSSAIFGIATAQLSAKVIDYTISLIEYFAEKDYGTFDCWFYEQEGTRGVLSPIVTSERLAFVPKRVLQGSGQTTVDRKPAMLVIFCSQYELREVHFFLVRSELNWEMKIVAFYSTEKQFNSAAFIFEKAKMPNVIFMQMDRPMVRFIRQFINKRRYEWVEAASFNKLFIDQTRDLNGYEVKISTSREKEIWSEWVNAAVEKMNGRYQYYVFTTSGSTNAQHYNESVMFDISMDKYLLGEIDDEILLPSMIPCLMVIAVRRGRELTVLEIFMAPFRSDLWIALLLLMVSCSILMLIRPIRPQNNLILLALCGIERRSLSTVNRLERFATISLIILFFLLTSAYESKLIELMTSKPHVPNVHTIDDLVRANITIRDTDTNGYFNGDPRLEQIFKYDPECPALWDPEDGTRAYTGPFNHIKMMTNLHLYYDSVNKRSNFIILDEALQVNVLAYAIEFRSALRSKFSMYQMAYFEAGLLQRTPEENPLVVLEALHQNQIRVTESVSFDVAILELLPAWYALMVGFSLAGFVLVIEIAYGACHLRSIKKYNFSSVLVKGRARKLMLKRRFRKFFS